MSTTAIEAGPHATGEAGQQRPRRHGARRRKWLIGGATIVLLVVILLVLRPGHRAPAPTARMPAAVPVAVTTAELRDVPITLDGLGTVTPIATVTVRSQVDGRLD